MSAVLELPVPTRSRWSQVPAVLAAVAGPLAWRLLQRIGELPSWTGREQLQGLAQEAGQFADESFMASGLALLQQMHEDRVIGIT